MEANEDLKNKNLRVCMTLQVKPNSTNSHYMYEFSIHDYKFLVLFKKGLLHSISFSEHESVVTL